MRFTRKGFREWLMQHRPRQIVGKREDECCCPIGRYLTHLHGGRWSVDGVTACPTWGPSIILPRWARRFVNTIDLDEGRITAAVALRVLDSI